MSGTCNLAQSNTFLIRPNRTKEAACTGATLIVAEVLKGNVQPGPVPIIIHYGLTPVIGGYVKRDSFMIDLRSEPCGCYARANYPKDVIEIINTPGSSTSEGE